MFFFNRIGNGAKKLRDDHKQEKQSLTINIFKYIFSNMRLVSRNRRVALLGVLCLFGLMVLFKFSEYRPNCLFKEDQAPVMLRDEVSLLILSCFLI